MSKRTSGDAEQLVRLREPLNRIEPDIRLLKGTVSVLRALSETSDAVEPVAIEAIAHLAGETLESLEGHWLHVRDLLR